MANYMNINGIDFQVIRPRDARKVDGMLDRMFHTHRYALEDCYAQCSAAKHRAYRFWREWFADTDSVYRFTITAYNTFGFSLGCALIDPATLEILGYVEITPCNHRVYLY